MSNSYRRLRPHAPSPARRLGIELLEDRSVPATFLVNVPGDTGTGTLRQAITDANTATGADDITFDPALTGQTIALASALPTITDTLTITGPGQTALTVKGAAGNRVFQVGAGVTATITDLIVTGGSPGANGGGILNNGTLTLQRVTVSGNRTTGGSNGGGIASSGAGASLMAQDCTVSGNTAAGSGAGIFNDTGTTATITDTVITGNTAGNNDNGAGVENLGTMTINGCTISLNSGPSTNATPNFFGGGVANLGSTGALTVLASTVVGNLSEGPGGGLFSNGASLSVTNSTVANNTSLSTPAGTGGGGIRVQGSGSLTVLNSTVTGNVDGTGSTTTNAGGISFGSTGPFITNNTVVAQNLTTTTGATAAPDVRSGVAVSGINNFVGSDPNALSNLPAAQTNLGDPGLGPLADNGGPGIGGLASNGPNLTRKPLPGSPLINAGNNAPAAVLTTDQRGFLRVVGTTVDIGAVEFQAPGVTVTLASSANPANAGAMVTFTATVAPTAAAPNNPVSGSVRFIIDGTAAGTVSLNASGTATFTTSTLTAATHTVRADYLGDANFSPGSATLTPPQVINLLPPPPPSVGRPKNLSVGGAANAVANVYAPSPAGVYTNPPTRQILATVFPGFAGDVRTATGDFNGDGTEDTVLVTGPGVKTQMAVVNGKDGSLLLGPTDPFGDPNFTFGGFVTAGDIDHDGKAEWVVTPELRGGPRVVIFRLNPAAASGITVVANFFGIQDDTFRDGARAALGDVNGDGILDVFVIAAFNGGPRTALFDGKDVLVHIAQGRAPNKLVGDFFASPDGQDTGRGGRGIAAGDVNGDGVADLIVTGDNLLGTGNQVTVFSGADLAAGKFPGGGATVLANYSVSGQSGQVLVSVATVDADGDTRADLAVGSGVGQESLVKVYLGKNLSGTTEPTSTSFDPFGAVTTNGVFVG
jgi:hypothetical protein